VTRSAAARGEPFATLTCSAPEARTARMAEIVLRHAPAGRRLRILDLGCGTGGLLFRLADAWPDAVGVGVDISSANISAADSRRRQRSDAARLAFHVVDYLSWDAAPFDVITIDGVLHLIPGDTHGLVAKIARDVTPGGIVVNAMPHACVYNSLFSGARRGLRAARARWTDAAILRIGRLLHPEMSEALLRERVHYMYLPPERVNDRFFEAACAASGLHPIDAVPLRSSSFAQLRHSITVMRKA
jgi:ubiquinone/menaquinone biosynthesis C-methylase UbiE